MTVQRCSSKDANWSSQRRSVEQFRPTEIFGSILADSEGVHRPCLFSPVSKYIHMSLAVGSSSHSRAGSSASGIGSSANRMLHIEPEELVFQNVQLKQTYKQSIRITNSLQVPVEFTIRSSHARYTVSPAAMTLKAGETSTVEVALKILHEIRPPTVAGVPQADHCIKDVFHLRSQFFAQRFHATMYPATAAGHQRQPSAVASPRSESNSAQPSPAHSRSASNVSFSGIQTVFNHSRNPSSASALQSIQSIPPSDALSARHSRNASSLSFCSLPTDNAQSKSGALASLSAHHSRNPSGSNLSVISSSGSAGGSSKISAAMDIVRREKAREKEQQRKADEKAAALREQQRLQQEAAEQKERDRHTNEAELYKPFERASLKEARANIAVSSLFPPSSLSTKDPIHSGTAVSTREFLALSQKARALQSELDAVTQERDQERFNYAQLEKEYVFALKQVDQLHAASRAHRPVDVQAQLDELLRDERAQLEVKNQRVLAVLRTKDAAIADREETIARQDRLLQAQAFRLGELEAQLQERNRIAQQMEREQKIQAEK
jgi:hypothetical protein